MAVMLSKWRDVIWPLVISSLGWPFYATLFLKYSGTGLEGASYVVGFASFALFALAAPLAGAVLGRIMQSGSMTFARFMGLFFLITSPMIIFQAVAVSVSVAQVFLRGPVTTETVRQYSFQAGLLTACAYGAQAVVLYFLAKKSEKWLMAGSILLGASTFAILAYKVIHA